MIHINIEKIEEYFIKAQYKECLNLIDSEDFISVSELSLDGQLSFYFYYLFCLNILFLDERWNKELIELKKNKNNHILFNLLIFIIEMFRHVWYSEFEILGKISSEVENKFDNNLLLKYSDDPVFIKWYGIKNNFIAISYSRTDTARSIHYFEKSIELLLKCHDRYSIYYVINIIVNKGEYHHSCGELDLALKFYKQSLDLSEEFYKKYNIRNIMREREILSSIGNLFYLRKEFNEALEYLEKVHELLETNVYKNNFNVISSHFDLFRVYLALKNQAKIDEHYNEIIKIGDDPFVDLKARFLVSKALYLINKGTMKDQGNAQEILKDMAFNDFFYNSDLIVEVLCYLAESYILEMKTFQNEETLSQLEKVIMKMKSLGEKLTNQQLIVQVLLIETKIDYIKGGFNEVETKLSKAYKIANENGLLLLLDKVIEEQKNISSEISKWKFVLSSKEDSIKKLETNELLTYIGEVRKMKFFNIR